MLDNYGNTLFSISNFFGQQAEILKKSKFRIGGDSTVRIGDEEFIRKHNFNSTIWLADEPSLKKKLKHQFDWALRTTADWLNLRRRPITSSWRRKTKHSFPECRMRDMPACLGAKTSQQS